MTHLKHVCACILFGHEIKRNSMRVGNDHLVVMWCTRCGWVEWQC